jgi:hypothetical protein
VERAACVVQVRSGAAAGATVLLCGVTSRVAASVSGRAATARARE